MSESFPRARFIAHKTSRSYPNLPTDGASVCFSSLCFSILPPRPQSSSSPAARSISPIITPGSVSLLVCQPLVVISSRLLGIADRLLDPPVSNYALRREKAVTGGFLEESNKTGVEATLRHIMFWSDLVIGDYFKQPHNRVAVNIPVQLITIFLYILEYFMLT